MKKLSKSNKVNEDKNITPDMKLTPLVEEVDPRTKECLMDALQPNDKTCKTIVEGNEASSPYYEWEPVMKFERFIQENRNIPQ